MKDVGEVLACLADPTRRRLLELLSSRGPMTATALAAAVAISRQGVAKHLRLMEQAGLLDTRPSGRRVLFEVRTHEVRAAAAWLDERARAWETQLRALKARAERS